MIFKPSHYQTNIFDFVANGEGHGIIEACAGSGKTSTAIESLNYIPSNLRVLFLAFNRHIADELKEKVPKGIRVQTVHSVGLQILKMNGFGEKTDKFKTHEICKEIIINKMNYSNSVFKAINKPIKNIIAQLKNNNMKPSKENIVTLMEYYSIHLPDNIAEFEFSDENIELQPYYDMDIKEFYKLIKKCFLYGINEKNTVDFDDMIFLPVHHNLEGYKYDMIICDEAQDFNKTQLELILKCVKPNGRIIAIGDKNQSIYSFRGADANSIQNIKERLDAKSLPLSITYRCPISHVNFVKQFVPEIEAAPDAEYGKIQKININKFYDTVNSGDLILCRYNSSLVKPCLKLIGEGRKASIKGLDFATNLKKIITSFGVKTIPELINSLEKWYSKELKKAEEYDLNTQPIEDKYESILELINSSDAENVKQITDYIDRIFSDKAKGISFSTVHKAKGLEAENVFILYPYLMPCKHAEKDWELEQEKNIQYVAYTRSKENMYMVYEN